MKRGKISLLLAGFLSFQASAESLWTKISEQDIKHIYSTVKNNHPGYLDKENAYFSEWLEQGYHQALEQGKTAESLQDVMTIIQTYVAGFGDGHFFLNLKYQPKKITWSGINIKKYGHDYRVSFADSNHGLSMPEPMAKLISCDGQAVDDIVNNQVLNYRFNTPELNFPKVWYASKILVDDGIGKRTHFKSCQFETNEVVKSVELTWRTISNGKYLTKTSANSKNTSFSFESMGDNQYWLTLPKFNLNQQQKQAIRDVIQQTKKVSPSAEHFVIDVRGNNGGNSEWGVEVAKAIYGEAFIQQHRRANPDNSYALWRVSDANAKHLQNVLPWIKEQFGEENNMYLSFSSLTTKMKTAVKAGDSFIRQGDDDIIPEVSSGVKVQAESNAKVLFLTDSDCGSACLDFADLLLTLPNVHHIGQETGADTVYMDIRHVKLPSGLGSYSLAQKVYRQRPRKHNQSYVPQHFYPANIADTPKVKAWIKTLSLK